MGDVGNGDDAYHNGAFYLAANFGFYTGFKPRKDPSPSARRAPSTSTTAPHDEYDFYLRMGPLANANENYLKNENVYWNDLLKHPNLRRVLAIPRAGAAHEERHARRAVRRRLVRCRRSRRPAEALPRRREERRPKRPTRWSWDRGCMAAGRAATASSSAI